MRPFRRPDIVVGIDVGQTCSGVAFSIGPDWSDPRIINRWPSRHGIEQADKVATRVAYSKTNNLLVNWGFECVFGDENVETREQFKLTLDPEYEDDRGFTVHDARRWYTDYLRCLHREIERHFEQTIPGWQRMLIEYNFSTPTTWRNPAMIAVVEGLIKSAGFSENANRTVRMGLTEAEAAAVEAATIRYSDGDIFIICDAGGGTTDVNVIKVQSAKPPLTLQALDQVEGVPIGSTLIDYRMAQHLVERLRPIQHLLNGDLFLLAEEMLTGRFQVVKHSFPHPVVDHFLLDIKGLAGSHDFPELGITNSRLSINRALLTEIFDLQLNQIFELIDSRLQVLNTNFPGAQVSYIILSGGLGSSPYLYDRVEERYGRNVGFRLANTASIRTMKVLDPQLAVVRGLVRERTQQIGFLQNAGGTEVFGRRCCRNSYGVAVKFPYDPAKHMGMRYVTDPHDQRRWVDQQIDWFIKQGEEVDPEGIRRPYGATLPEQQRNDVRVARIFMSSLPNDRLPNSTTDAGAKEVAVVKYRLTDNDMQMKKSRQFWKAKKPYWLAAFFLVIQIGPADLHFQIRGSNGILSTDHESLDVEFIGQQVEPHGQNGHIPSPVQGDARRKSTQTPL